MTITTLYSLGCTLYYLLIGRPPFGIPQYRTVIGKMTAHAQGLIPTLRDSRPEVHEKLDQLYQKLLAKDAEARIQTGIQVAKALEPFLPVGTNPSRPAPMDPTSVELPSQARVEGRRTMASRGANPGRLLLVTAALMVVVAAVFFATRNPNAALSPSPMPPVGVAESPTKEPLAKPSREVASNNVPPVELATPASPSTPQIITENGWLACLLNRQMDADDDRPRVMSTP